ncbi:PaaX family transcriptional regulator C-terminal domain-containing protein [Streptomyces sp. NPDC050095]|uniref:PaaX family transcriptional regulator C-terminal domain-containing protein n=1 Tax=Streptomyces sp. NPDC050095 TaxID=3155512 RepID=UPI00341C7FFD
MGPGRRTGGARGFERDPRLPEALLPPDWPGRDATRLFVEAWRALRSPACAYWRQLADST